MEQFFLEKLIGPLLVKHSPQFVPILRQVDILDYNE
jgi:hypothetical protein